MTTKKDDNTQIQAGASSGEESSLDKQGAKLVFAEGCFNDFEGTQEELAALIAQIHQMHSDGRLIGEAVPLSSDEARELDDHSDQIAKSRQRLN